MLEHQQYPNSPLDKRDDFLNKLGEKVLFAPLTREIRVEIKGLLAAATRSEQPREAAESIEKALDIIAGKGIMSDLEIVECSKTARAIFGRDRRKTRGL